MVLRQSRIGRVQACSIRQCTRLASVGVFVMARTWFVGVGHAVVFPVFFKRIRVVSIVDYVRDQTAKVVRMQPTAAQTTICQGDEKTNSSKVGVPLRLVGRAVCEGADSGVLIVDEIDEIRMAIVEARRQRLVFDDTIQLDCSLLVCRLDATRSENIRSGMARCHAIV